MAAMTFIKLAKQRHSGKEPSSPEMHFQMSRVKQNRIARAITYKQVGRERVDFAHKEGCKKAGKETGDRQLQRIVVVMMLIVFVFPTMMKLHVIATHHAHPFTLKHIGQTHFVQQPAVTCIFQE